MTRAAAFTAELVRSSSRGLAGLAASRFYERCVDAQDRYGEEGFESWRQAMAARLQSLSAALDSRDEGIFVDDLNWFRSVSGSRGIPREDLALALECLEQAMRESLPEDGAEAIGPFMDSARAAIDAPGGLPPEFAPGSDAAELFELALLGDLGGARHFVLDGIRGKRFTVPTAVTDVILPAAREAGRRWHLGQMGVAAEHVITATLRSALHSITAVLPPAKPNGKAAFVAAVAGDAHDTGLLAFALLLEQAGWRVALAGADTPIDEVDATAEGYRCDLIALSATQPSQRFALSSYLAKRSSKLPVLLGGSALRSEDDARNLGASGFAANLETGLEVASRLVGLG